MRSKILLGSLAFVILGWIALEIVDPGYTRNFLVGLDVFANTVIFGEVETISARLGRRETKGDSWSEFFCDILDVVFIEPDHCLNALDAE